jgi:hypothetical protein
MASSSPAASPKEIVIISHSPIFYWWPVWFVGFLMAALTYFDGHLMAIVPAGTVAERARAVEGHEEPRDVLILPPGKPMPQDKATGTALQPRLRMAASNNLGMIFAITLCLVIVVTNIHLRGLWTVIVILGILAAAILIALLGLWDIILGTFGLIDIHINALGYLGIALFVFAIWALTILLYDRHLYLIFSRGQLRVRRAIGAGEMTYDTFGIMVEKHVDDVFRHWLLGFGSGDLTVRTAGTNAQQFDVVNVLRVNRKLALIQQMLQEREVVRGQS